MRPLPARRAAAPDGQRSGLLFAFAAFGAWGFFPIYFKALRDVDPFEILAHRVLWSVPLLALLVAARRDGRALVAALVSRRTLLTLAASSVLIAVNWLTFIYAVTTDRLVSASLGYYINPLVNVLLGLLFLGERLRRPQVFAVVLAAAGTANLALGLGRLPWIALVLAFTFGLYGLLRKTVGIESVNGLLVEVTLLSPLAAIWLVVLLGRSAGAFVRDGVPVTLLLLAGGIVTALPLIWFTSAARRLRYATLGLVQYLAPTLQLLLAVVVYGEPFTRTHAVTFVAIWAGLAIFAADAWIAQRRTRRDAQSPSAA